MPRKAMKDIAEFKKAFDQIKAQGPVKSGRGGATGVGHTLETLLGLEEDNKDRADLGFAELKAHRKGSNALITLFTFDRNAWLMNKKDAIENYGTADSDGRMGLYFTLRHEGEITQTGLKLVGDKKQDTVSVLDEEGKILAQWTMEKIAKKFMEKIPALVVVTAESEHKPGGEHFKYTEAMFYTNPVAEKICQQILAGNVSVDLRMHDAITKVRNHGTAFRVYEQAVGELFENKQKV